MLDVNGIRLWLLILGAASTLPACAGPDRTPLPADPRAILQAHISHGIGESPLDSPLVQDELAAEMIVRARKCVPARQLRELADDSAHGVRLLEQLRSDGLVDLREETACTTFPVLVGEEQAAYAAATRDLAAAALRALDPELDGLTRTVAERGWTEWQYHFVWSQLFDSQVAWTEMMQRNLVPPLDRLIAWCVYPDHPFRSGTNYYPDSELRDHWLMVTWRANGANTVALLGETWEIIYGAALEGRPMSGRERAKLAQLGLVDEAGHLRMPVLRSGDPLLDTLRSVALRYVDFLEREMPLDFLTTLTGVDGPYTFAMAYHDISWEIVGRLAGSRRIGVPPALNPGPGRGDPSMRGVAAIAPAHAPFVDRIRRAIERR